MCCGLCLRVWHGCRMLLSCTLSLCIGIKTAPPRCFVFPRGRPFAHSPKQHFFNLGLLNVITRTKVEKNNVLEHDGKSSVLTALICARLVSYCQYRRRLLISCRTLIGIYLSHTALTKRAVLRHGLFPRSGVVFDSTRYHIAMTFVPR